MPTLSKSEYDNKIVIRIVHDNIKHNKYKLVTEPAGNHSIFVGVLMDVFKYGFSVNSKKYDTENIETEVVNRNKELIITIPRFKHKQESQTTEDLNVN